MFTNDCKHPAVPAELHGQCCDDRIVHEIAMFCNR